MPPTAPARPGHGAQGAISFRLAGLGNRFVELFGRKLSQRAFAAEMARLIAEAVKLKAVAVLAYDRHRDRLALLADEGLSDDARAALGSGGDCTWEIPQRGLRNRRISVIEAAQQNPFVPRPLINLSPQSLSVASLPIYFEQEPTAVLLLFAVGSRAFPDGQLHTLSQAVRVCARGLRMPDRAPSRGRAAKRPAISGEMPAGPTPSRAADSDIRRSVAPYSDESEASLPQLRLVETPNPRATEGEISGSLVGRVQSLEHRLAHARDEIDRNTKKLSVVTASGNVLVRERDSLVQQLAEVERQRENEGTAQRAEINALQERLLAVDGERARYQRLAEDRHTRAQQSLATLESERTALNERTQAAESVVAELQAALTAVRGERGRLGVQVENLGNQLRAAEEGLQRTQAYYAEERAAIDGDREAWKQQASSLRTELAQRGEQLATLDAELRGAVVARDAASSQLQAARAEIDRLMVLTEEVGRSTTQLEAARAGAAAESAALSRALEAERAARAQAEQALHTALSAAQAEAERVAAESAVLRAEIGARTRAVAERDEQLAQLHEAYAAARQAEAGWQETQAAQRGELAALSARLEQSGVERERLLAERETLRVTLVETRQHADHANVAHAAAFGQLEAEAVELRRHVETLTAERTTLLERQQRAVDDGRSLTRRLAESQRRGEELSELLQQRDGALEAAAADRERQAAQQAGLTGQLHASHEAFERAQARSAQEHTALVTDRDGWKVQAEAMRAELAQRTDSLATREHDLRGTIVARDALAADLQTAREEIDSISATADELRHTVAQLEAARTEALTETATLRHSLESDRAHHLETEHALRATVAALQTERQQEAATAALLRDELAERTRKLADRDERLTALRNEIDALRQQSADRGVLAQQAAELGSKIVELEQQLAAARAEGARADRQRAALAESLEAARHREAEAAATAARERTDLTTAVDSLTQERARLEGLQAAQQGEIEGLRTTVADLDGVLRQTRAAHAAAEEAGHEAGRQLAETQRRLDALHEVVREREAAVAAATDAQQQMAAQLGALREEIRVGQEAVEAAHARYAQEQGVLQADRNAWREQAAAAHDELQHTAAQLEAARSRTVAENAALQQTLDDERAAHQRAADALRTELSRMHSTAEQLSGEAATLRDAVAERDTQLAALRQSEEAARQAEAEWEQTTGTLRAELLTLRARLDDSATERDQLREARAAVEHQLALVVATRGAEEQTLAQGLHAAREQVAQLEEERATWQVALAEARQQLGEADAAHSSALKQAQTDAAQLRKLVKTLTAAKTKLIERADLVEQQRLTEIARREDEGRRAAGLAERCAQLDQALTAVENRRAAADDRVAQLRADMAALTARLDARDSECTDLQVTRSTLEQQLALAASSQGEREQALAQELEGVRTRLEGLEQERVTLLSTLSAAQQHVSESAAALEQMRAESDSFLAHRESLATERAQLADRLERAERERTAHGERADAESRRSAALAEQCARLQHALEESETQRATFDGELARTRAEIAGLRQQSADRGVLAHQAAELESRVIELEQEVAAVRGEAAGAERQRAAVAQELEQARRQQAEALATVQQDQTALQATLQQLTDERSRMEAEHAVQQGQLETQRATLADLQAAFEQVQAEQATAETCRQDATHRLADAHRRLEEFSAAVHQRDAALESANGERRRLTAQLAKLTSQLRASQDALESAQGRDALERAALEAQRDRWKETAEAALGDRDRATTAAEELQRAAMELEVARAAAAAEAATLSRTLDVERASRIEIEQLLRADCGAARAEAERLTGDSAALRGELAERDAQLEALRQAREAAHQAEIDWQRTSGALRSEVAALSAQLEESGAVCQQLRVQHEQVEQQLAEVAATRGEAEQAQTQAWQSSQVHIARLEHDGAQLRSALGDARQRLLQADAAHAEMLGQLQTEAGDLHKQVKSLTTARDALAERVERAEQTLAAHAERLETESRRAAALGEQCTQLEQSVVTAETRRAALGGELAQARAEVEAFRQHSADRGALAHQASELGGKVVALEQEVAALRSAAGTAERQQAALAAELDAARRQQTQALAAAERQRAALEESVQRLSDERDRLETERAAQRAEAQTQHAALVGLQAAVERSDADRARAEEAQQQLTQRIVDTQRRLDEVTDRLRQRETALTAALAERQRSEEAVRVAEAAAAQLVTERDALSHQVHEVTLQLEHEFTAAARASHPDPQDRAADDAPHPPTMSPDDETPPVAENAPLIIERSAPLGAVIDTAPPAEPPTEEPSPSRPHKAVRPTGELVLLDEGPIQAAASDALKGAGFEVTLAAPTVAVVDEIARRKIKCVLLNLGVGPTAWQTLKALRERVGTRTVPVLAYVMTPQSPLGFCFGRAEYVLWPSEPGRVVERLVRMRPKLKRLLVASADVDGIGKLREPLAKQGISSSMVLDGKQAMEFATMIGPEAAILHLSPSCPAIARAVVGLRTEEATRDVPLLFLLDKTGATGEDAFFVGTNRQLLGKPTFHFSNLPEEIARLVG